MPDPKFSHAFVPNESRERTKEENQKKEQEQRYAESGITSAFVKETLESISVSLARGERPGYDRSFYRDSSDPLREMRDVFTARAEKHVVTVAGAGDFPQLFIDAGAEQLEIFDISPFAAFWTELKLQSLVVLSFEEYTKFLNDSEVQKTLFDATLYPTVRPHLSEQARTCFDTIQQPEYRNLFVLPEKHDLNSKCFAKKRGINFVERCIHSSGEYEVLRKKVMNTRWTIDIKDLDALLAEKPSPNTAFYMSNIGIDADIIVWHADRIAAAGYEKVYMSIILPGYEFSSAERFTLRESTMLLHMPMLTNPEQYVRGLCINESGQAAIAEFVPGVHREVCEEDLRAMLNPDVQEMHTRNGSFSFDDFFRHFPVQADRVAPILKSMYAEGRFPWDIDNSATLVRRALAFPKFYAEVPVADIMESESFAPFLAYISSADKRRLTALYSVKFPRKPRSKGK